MYKYYSFTLFTLNTKGGAEITSEKCTKEVDGNIVPCNEAESILKMLDKVSKVGGNPSTQNVKALLFSPNGGLIKEEEVIKDAIAE